MTDNTRLNGHNKTLHQQIRYDIEQKILSGEWLPGFRIPYERELMAQYCCSRMTVNKAITSLAENGFVHRRRRAGSFVARPKLQSVVLDIPDIQSEVAERGLPYGFQLLSRRRRYAQCKKPEEAEFDANTPMLVLRCLHQASHHPFVLEERWINLDAVPEAEGLDFDDVSPERWFSEHVAWSEAQHRISAVAASGDQATLLNVEQGAACLLVERQTWRSGEGLSYVRQLFPGNSYNLVAQFAPSHG